MQADNATYWHDTYQSEVNARDEFFGDLLELLPGAEDAGMDAYDQIPRAIKALRAERDQLRAHILDIDAHATPYEDLPDDPGYVGLYLLTSGALHRALGKVGHTAVPCQDAKKVAEVMEKLEEAERSNRQVVAERDALKAELAAMQEQIEGERKDYSESWQRLMKRTDEAEHKSLAAERRYVDAVGELAEARAAIERARGVLAAAHAYEIDELVADTLAALDASHRPENTAEDPRHTGGNAEDCPACSGTNPPYPFICPGTPESPESEETTDGS